MSDRSAVVMISIAELEKLVRAAVRDEIQAMAAAAPRKPQKRRPHVEVKAQPSKGTIDETRRKLRRLGVPA